MEVRIIEDYHMPQRKFFEQSVKRIKL